MDILALFIAGLSFLFSLWIYKTHDRKIKRQESFINSYQIEKIRQEKEESNAAIIEVNLKQISKGDFEIIISNKGKSAAKNINVMLPELKDTYFLSKPSPFELRPSKTKTIPAAFSISTPDSFDVQVQWDDERQSGNMESFTLDIYN